MTDTQRCLAVYGDPSTPAFDAKWLVRHPLPAAVIPHFPPYGAVRPTAIFMNRFAATALDAVLLELLATGLIRELKTYDGCQNLRKKRGINEYSIHSWGLALDFNAATNPLGGHCSFTPAFLAVWRKHGWDCGADWAGRADPMHFQYTRWLPPTA